MNIHSFKFGTVRFLVEIWMWRRKRFHWILKSHGNASRDQSTPKNRLNPIRNRSMSIENYTRQRE